MKLAFIATMAFAVTVSAWNCEKDRHYCGHTLLRQGKQFPPPQLIALLTLPPDSTYRPMMDAATEKAGVTDTHNARQTLFRCTDSSTGDIEVDHVCSHYKCDVSVAQEGGQDDSCDYDNF